MRVDDEVIIISGYYKGEKGIIFRINDYDDRYKIYFYNEDDTVWVDGKDINSFKKWNRDRIIDEILNG